MFCLKKTSNKVILNLKTILIIRGYYMAVYINQVGYQTIAKKTATISGENKWKLINEAGECVLEGTAPTLKRDANSGESVSLIDFSCITEKGRYHFETESGKSYNFEISDDVFESLFYDIMKMFYFQRCGMELTAKHAGKFTHKACHTAPVSVLRNENIKFECSGGWHDAGDFGRYSTAGAVALGHLLYAYEIMPENFNVDLNIPESGNGVPDILNECRYELEWLLKMQKDDGGVYHKCTSIKHTDFIMPEDDPLPFIVTPVSSMAVGDFVAVTALASRIYAKFDAAFSKKLKEAAIKSYKWLQDNPGFLFENPKECTTGGYDDMCDADERLWALAEYVRLTGDKAEAGKFGRMLELQISTTALGWGDVGGFAALSVITDKDGLFDETTVETFKGRWLDEADNLIKTAKENDFELAMRPYHFGWGSNMIVLNNASKLAFAYVITGESQYKEYAMAQIDYILGRNAMNTSYVTCNGEGAYSHPHNRPSEADGIDEAIPGQVSGGPNGHPCDEAALRIIPAGTAPMKCYADDWGSYSTNEITIYWNSPLVLALGLIK